MDAERIRIRPALVTDLPGLHELAAKSGGVPQWSAAQYSELLTPMVGSVRKVLVAEEGLRIVGFSVAVCHQLSSPDYATPGVEAEWELEIILVSAEKRRTGLGMRLLQELLNLAGSAGAKAIFLEVRASNQNARFLYERAGFKICGSRVAYYHFPTEEAIIYQLLFCEF